MTTGRLQGSVVEEILVLLRANPHVLLAKVVDMGVNVVCILLGCELLVPSISHQ